MVQAPPGSRQDERRREILGAAARVFRRRGFHDAGMREIAAELDMAVGNLYYYFQNKRELLAYCQMETLDELLASAGRIGELEIPADGKLRRLIRSHLRSLHEGTPGSLAHLEVESLSDDWRPRVIAKRNRYERALRSLVETGIRDGSFRPVDPGVAVRTILGALNWTVRWYRPGGRLDLSRVETEICSLLVDGLGGQRTVARGA
ncbi:MAG: TetR/AcrR family transcriptional regulator [Thermoanaerobaculia bacterium]|nr:TetR/AcrR family transcriptional regulator [Thermoanaerobaculia bacterium]